MPRQQRKNLQLRNFSKGLVTHRPPLHLDISEAAIAENVEFDRGTVKRREGWTLVATPPGGASVTGLFPYYFQTTKQLLAVNGTTLSRSTGGAFTTITSTLATAPIYPTFAALSDVCYIAVRHGADLVTMLKRWDGTAFTEPTTPNGSLVTTYGNALWLAGDTAAPSRIYWSGLVGGSGPDAWPVANFINLNPGDGDKITGLAGTINALLVFKERSVHRLSGEPPDDAAISAGTLGAIELKGHPGCVAPLTVAENSNFVAYLNRKGVFLHDGTKAVELTEAIRPFFATINETGLQNAVGAWLTPTHYLLSLNVGGVQTQVSIHLTPAPVCSIWKGLSLTALSTFQFTGELEKAVLGFAGGQVGKYGGNTDNGAAVAWKYRSGVLPMGSPFLLKTVRRGYIRGSSVDSAVTLTLLPEFQETGRTASVNFNQAGQDASTRRFITSATGRTFEFEMSGNTSVIPEIQEVTVEYLTRYRR